MRARSIDLAGPAMTTAAVAAGSTSAERVALAGAARGLFYAGVLLSALDALTTGYFIANSPSGLAGEGNPWMRAAMEANIGLTLYLRVLVGAAAFWLLARAVVHPDRTILRGRPARRWVVALRSRLAPAEVVFAVVLTALVVGNNGRAVAMLMSGEGL